MGPSSNAFLEVGVAERSILECLKRYFLWSYFLSLLYRSSRLGDRQSSVLKRSSDRALQLYQMSPSLWPWTGTIMRSNDPDPLRSVHQSRSRSGIHQASLYRKQVVRGLLVVPTQV